MCTLVSRENMTFYIFAIWYTVPGNQGAHDKLNQIRDIRFEYSSAQFAEDLPALFSKLFYLEGISETEAY